ncbi:hypothetical protein BAQU_1479 [Bifidobacterium aquikefiri]|uniref:Uncharacterized protein n=1 Tax=Bifidobacterium aquikefiri TaxID=1653207 RepID=A0A261G2T2_9BIFI|nr:hypothetical protein BAQU_1479 [Bifidobacterium aquikefiri]
MSLYVHDTAQFTAGRASQGLGCFAKFSIARSMSITLHLNYDDSIPSTAPHSQIG